MQKPDFLFLWKGKETFYSSFKIIFGPFYAKKLSDKNAIVFPVCYINLSDMHTCSKSIDAVHMFNGQMFHFVKEERPVQYFVLFSFSVFTLPYPVQ